MGGKTTSTSATKLNGITVQSLSLGLALTLGWGRGRAKCNLLDYVAFTATPHTTNNGGGKGLFGGGSKNTSYTYTASILLGLCEGGAGGIPGIRTVYKDSSVFTNGATTALAQAGLSLANGAAGQAPWSYLTSSFPDHALAYGGIAYLYAQDYGLGDNAELPNHSFELDFPIQFDPDKGDALPSAIATDYLTNAQYGLPGWSAGLIGDWSAWASYCKAAGLLLSPVEEAQRNASDFLTEITDASNTAIFWSEGKLKTVPLGDAMVTGHGVTFVPDLTPVYDLDEDDFCPQEGEPPVSLNIVDQSDAYNIVQVEFLDRANQYNSAIATAQDLDNIVTYGRRKQDPTNWHSICDAQVAQSAAQLLLQRTLYIREEYRFRLAWDSVLLEPGDLVTLTTASDGLKLSRLLVRIREIEEDEDGLLRYMAKPIGIGTASAPFYTAHSSDGHQPNAEVAPGSIDTPLLFAAPSSLTGGAKQIWCAASSTSPTWGGCEVWISADGTNYAIAGRITAPARYGVLTAALPGHDDPDMTNTLAVDLGMSRGTLASVTDAEMDAGATLALIDQELIAYRDATPTAAHAYMLAPLRRGLHGTAPAAHLVDAHFVRLDDALFKIGYSDMNLGSTMYVKLPSFNLYGRAREDLAEAAAYSVSLDPLLVVPPAPGATDWSVTGTSIASSGGSQPAIQVTRAEGATVPPDVTSVQFEIRTTGSTDWTGATLEGPGITTKLIQSVAPGQTYEVAVSYSNTSGQGPRAVYGPATAGTLVADDTVSGSVAAIEQINAILAAHGLSTI